MKVHHFFSKDKWIGEGNILIEGEDTSCPMHMKMEMKEANEKNPVYEFTTEMHMQGFDEVVVNSYTITMHRQNKFHVLIYGENWGYVEGDGFVKEDFIGWEVTSLDGAFHGFESLELKKSGEIAFFGEYAAEGMRTKIEGLLTSYENISY
ncbi:hypothetical protein K0U07_00630 [bacterium]|nr:hypothetical protein [bacterium]